MERGDGGGGRWREGEMERGGDGERRRWREAEMDIEAMRRIMYRTLKSQGEARFLCSL